MTTSLIEFFGELRSTRGDVATYSISGRPAVLVNDPDVLEEVLVEHPRRLSRDEMQWPFAVPLLTERGRACVQRSDAQGIDLGSEIAAGLSAAFGSELAAGRRNVDIVTLAHRVGLETMARILFDFDIDAELSADFLDAALQVERINMERRAALHMSSLVSSDRMQDSRLKEGIARLISVGSRIHAHAQRRGLARQASTDLQTARGIVELLLFSFESFANVIASGIVLVSRSTEAAEWLREDERLGESVVREVLRVFPPAWMTARRVLVESVIGGVNVVPSTVVVVCPYTLHRHPRHWPNPEVFDPSRFAPSAGCNPRAYRPFGGGPRMCTASGFAIRELRTALADLHSTYDFVSEGPLVPIELVSLRPNLAARVQLSVR